VRFSSAMPDNNINTVMIWWWLRQREKRGQWKRKHWMESFFRDNLNSGASIVSKELFKSFYRMSTESFSLLVVLVGPQFRRKFTDFRTVFCQQKKDY
jgi:hypothetical protein